MYIYKEDFKKIVIALLIGILVFMISLFFFNKLQSSLLASIAFLVFNSPVLAKSITLDELQNSQANFNPS